MKNKIILLLIVVFLIFVFVIFFKGLTKTNIYTPVIKKKIYQNLQLNHFSGKSNLTQKICLTKIKFIC